MKDKFINFFKKIYNIVSTPSFRILPGQLSFFFVLSIVPMITLIGLVGGIFGISLKDVVGLFIFGMPDEIKEFINGFVSGKVSNEGIIWIILVTFYLSSNGANSIITASNELYCAKYDNYFKRRIKAIFMTILIVLLLIFIILVPAFGSFILDFLNKIPIASLITDELLLFFNILKWPFSFFIIFIAIKIVYTIAPDVRIKSKEVNLGAFITTIGWIIATNIYTYYASNFANYDVFYGSLSNIIILFLWIYILSYIFVLGMAFNSSSHDKYLEKITK